MPDSALPPHLRGALHTDWPWPFSKIPRGWTAWAWGRPVLISGNTTEFNGGRPKPIPRHGEWAFFEFPDAPWYWAWAAWGFAFTLASGRHFRIGARWDDVDDYVEWPSIASRKFPRGMRRDIST